MRVRGLRLRSVDLPAVAVFVTLGVTLVALLFGLGWWWKALLLGWVVGVPLTAILTGGSEEDEEATGPVEEDEDAALDALRQQYATGDISEAEFERRVERLLETESVEEARERLRERDEVLKTELSG